VLSAAAIRGAGRCSKATGHAARMPASGDATSGVDVYARFYFVDSVGPLSTEVCRTAASFP
jgi:hypothetical protein